jgi:hypothetical protein
MGKLHTPASPEHLQAIGRIAVNFAYWKSQFLFLYGN